MVNNKILLIVIMFLSLSSLTYANYTPIINDSSILHIDLNVDNNIYFIIFIVAMAILIALFKLYLVSGVILLVIGLMLLFNGFNTVISLIITSGVLLVFVT